MHPVQNVCLPDLFRKPRLQYIYIQVLDRPHVYMVCCRSAQHVPAMLLSCDGTFTPVMLPAHENPQVPMTLLSAIFGTVPRIQIPRRGASCHQRFNSLSIQPCVACLPPGTQQTITFHVKPLQWPSHCCQLFSHGLGKHGSSSPSNGHTPHCMYEGHHMMLQRSYYNYVVCCRGARAAAGMAGLH
jgi:hypothetical protein